MSRTRSVAYPGWDIVRLIGSGSYGTVYEIQRKVQGKIERSALKVISIPQNESEITGLRADGYDDRSIRSYYKDSLDIIENEYAIMATLKGHANIVHCEDVQTVPHEDGLGWDIYIRMELLTSLKNSLPQTADEEIVVDLGRDICRALEACEENNIIHRDIKPENIFVSKDRNFKLGDFGIAKISEGTATGTKTGTYDYMAPEVYNNQHTSRREDIYSLGLVMYWMLNDRTAPFLSVSGGIIPTADMKQEAWRRRFEGEELPEPAHGSSELKEIVMKACAFDPSDRFQNAAEMREALEALNTGSRKNSKAFRKEPADPSTEEEQQIAEEHPEHEESETGTVGPQRREIPSKKGNEIFRNRGVLQLVLNVLTVIFLLYAPAFYHRWLDIKCSFLDAFEFWGFLFLKCMFLLLILAGVVYSIISIANSKSPILKFIRYSSVAVLAIFIFVSLMVLVDCRIRWGWYIILLLLLIGNAGMSLKSGKII